MTDSNPSQPSQPSDDQLWLELAPHRPSARKRLLVFLHAAGSTPESFAPVAVSWQLKFTSATAIVMSGFEPAPSGDGLDWYQSTPSGQEAIDAMHRSAQQLRERIESAQARLGIAPGDTAVVGFSQGAIVALALAMQSKPCVDLVVSYSGRLLQTIKKDSVINANVHLVHGEFDSINLAIHSERAYRWLAAAGARVSLDIISGAVHQVGQDMVNVGSTRAMQTIYRGRKSINLDQFAENLSTSIDSGFDPVATRAHDSNKAH